ncbi:MAG TPA: phosphatidylglycerophosphatase A [Stellaceae bacterium]|nr:phosphatidylglycerophosphatase A [Stellaceae bacterium]
MADPAPPRALAWHHPAMLLATWFGAGRLPGAPGTWGSLAALPVAWLITATGGTAALLIAALLIFLVGWIAAHRALDTSRSSDPGWIVIDEVAGQWLTLALPPLLLGFAFLDDALGPLGYLLGFGLFRVMDIWKPWPVSLADQRVPGGLGVMLDDMLAGVYAGGCLTLILWGLDHVGWN